MNDKMRILVGKLDNTRKKLVSEVTKKGSLSLKAAQLGRVQGYSARYDYSR